METSENKEIDKIKEKIIDLVLNIPLEKWNRTSTQINETTIFIEKKDHQKMISNLNADSRVREVYQDDITIIYKIY